MRQLSPALFLVLSGALAACANPGMPRGAPVDRAPPRVDSTVPAQSAVNFADRDIEFLFNEVVSERVSGAPSLQAMFLISPSQGDPRVVWKRRALSVRPRQDWLPNTTYTVTLLPGVTDLQNNVAKEGATLVFSTGDKIDSARITGTIFDWSQERVVPRAIVRAHRVIPRIGSDTTAPRDTAFYTAASDSLGRFELTHLPVGEYDIAGFIDGNQNRALDPRNEKYDTARVTVSDSVDVELLAFAHDSVGPIIERVAVRDSFTVIVTFLRPVSPTQPLDSTFLKIANPDSSRIPVVLIRPERPSDTPTNTPAARIDSIRQAQAQRADTGARQVRQAVAPSRPRPPQSFVVQVSTALTPGNTYLVLAGEVRGLLGIASKPHRFEFTVPPRGDGRGGMPPNSRTPRG